MLISNIVPDGPAEKAGIKPQDVVVAINDRRIATYEQMVSMMKQISPDNEVSLKVKRGNEYKHLKAKLTSPRHRTGTTVCGLQPRTRRHREEVKLAAADRSDSATPGES